MKRKCKEKEEDRTKMIMFKKKMERERIEELKSREKPAFLSGFLSHFIGITGVIAILFVFFNR